ncbi:hypothetical protein V8E51_009827 [Hyaloscypha variabilis]|uniref:Zn(2)-C6 fungal-type domain-containing protein n=1 Tax=Hyaloscypha variabilis (strain UAMH 11265 / GT02V1 / F) TaxID=1149755 RepID=A0A2J6S854_HYAVF|nr:hypothetical protein L207DRAFT_149496 [Hyaloscypha variabilis F]
MTTHNYSAGMASDAFDGLAWQEPPSQNQMPIRATEMVSGSGAPRVCDMCMLKKRKCNRKRPICSRCLEDNLICIYSSSKKKPGPAKGSQRKKPKVSHAQTPNVPTGKC